ncbi:MAG: hypothetical protein JWM68_1581 [Verrucomicrobiales bacterium]|nr:hypothetical protein [Verrucomicrobiales bacterium]
MEFRNLLQSRVPGKMFEADSDVLGGASRRKFNVSSLKFKVGTANAVVSRNAERIGSVKVARMPLEPAGMKPALYEETELFSVFSSAPGRCAYSKKEKDNVMENPVATSIPDVMASAAKMKSAAENPDLGVPLVVNTAVNIGTDADALTTTRNNHEQGKVVLANSRAVLLSIIITVRVFLALGRDMMKPFFGNLYTEAFDILGFSNGKLQVPFTAEELLPMLQAYKAFYVANPLRENVPSNLTAAQAQVLYDQLNVASNNVSFKRAQVLGLKDVRDGATVQLRKRIRDVIKELEMRLDPLDSRWIAFGLNRPGAQETPDGVGQLTAVLIGPNAAALKWPAPARAEFYHVFRRIQGVDAEMVLIGSPADLDFNIENLPSNAHVDLAVAAVNSGGEGPRSEVVTIITH